MFQIPLCCHSKNHFLVPSKTLRICEKIEMLFLFLLKGISLPTNRHKTHKMNAIQTAIQDIRTITRIYDQFANQPQYFIEHREHSIIISLTEFAETATKLNNSDNYKPTDEEDNYWEWMFAEVEEFADKMFELIQDPEQHHGAGQWIQPLLSALMILYTEFNGRICENGEGLERVGEELY